MIDRLLAALSAIIRGQFPALTFLGLYEYTVQAATAGTVDCAPASALLLPALASVPMVPSLLSQRGTPVVGAPCFVRFVNGDPTRPACVGIGQAPAEAIIDATSALRLGPSAAIVVLAGGSLPIARVGDAVTVFLPFGLFSGTINGSPVTAVPLLILSQMSGIIGAGGLATA